MIKSLANAFLALQVVLVGSVLFLPQISESAINEQIPFYGTLKDTSGTNLSGTYDMVFRFYDSASGGTLLDTSTHTAGNGNAVTVTNGEFSALLGSGTGNALNGIDFNTASIYVGITIGADSEMTPRERLGSSAYSFNTDTLDGYDSLDLLRLNATNTIQTSSATPLLTIIQNGIGDILNIFDGGTEVFTIIDGGNVGVGTTTPMADFSVSGNFALTGGLYDNNATRGTAGQVLQTTGTGLQWVSTSTLGISGGGGSLFTDGGATTYLTSLSDNLAIGGNTSSHKLSVTGNINFDGNYALYFNNTKYLYASSTSRSVSFGYRAGEFDTGSSNVILGESAGRNNTGIENSIIGLDAGYTNSGDGNLIFGDSAGYQNTSHNNILFGALAGYYNEGRDNIAIGENAGYQNQGRYNLFFGQGAGGGNIGTSSIMIGDNAGYYNGGWENIFLGNNTFLNGTTGDNNALIGTNAVSGSGSFNNVFGYEAGSNGDYNNFIGYQTAEFNDGDFNDFMGYQTGKYLNATSTVAIGGLALRGGVTSQINILNTTAVGYRAGYAVRSGGNNNIFLGYQAGDNITTGDNNIIIGYDIDHISAALSNRLNIGNLIFGNGIDGTSSTISSGNIAIGTTSPNHKLTVEGNINLSASTGSIYFDDVKYLYASGVNDSIIFGENAGATFTNNTIYNVAIGYEAGRYASTSLSDYNVFLGYRAGYGNTGEVNTLLGYQAGVYNRGTENVALGWGAGYTNLGNYNSLIGTLAGSDNTGLYNNIFGYQTGRNNTGDYNNILGEQAGLNNTGDDNNLFGRGAGYANTGNLNNVFGYYAGGDNTGLYNNLFGYDAGRQNTGDYNSLFGRGAGYANTGDYNNLIGYYTGSSNTGVHNTFMGAFTGAYNTGRDNVFMGWATGYNLRATSTIAIGKEALAGAIDDAPYVALNNIAIGERAGFSATTSANNNILLGYYAADNLTTGNNNIIIGYDIDNVTATADNRLNIGNLIFGTGLDGTGTTLASGNVGIGSTSPASKLSVAGSIYVTGAYRDTSGDAGLNGQVLLSTLAGTNWTSTSSLGIGGSLSNNSVTPNYVFTTGQTDEYCLTYESTGATWEWQTCGVGGSLFTDGGATTYLTAGTDNLGIGTTTSTAKLSVHGELSISNLASGISFGTERMIYASSTIESVAFGRFAGATWNGTEYGNVAIGYDAGRFSSTTFENILIGVGTGRNSSGDSNTIVGTWSGSENSGNQNSIIGYYSGYANTGSYNNIIGYEAGYNNSGLTNSIIGYRAGYDNTGDDNVLVGLLAGYTNKGENNVAIGTSAGRENLGLENVMIGQAAGYDNVGTSSVMIGTNAGIYNYGLRSTLLGYEAGFLNGGDYVASLGFFAGGNNTGDFNNLIGYMAGYDNNGDYNNYIGYQAGGDESDGSYNDFVGYQAGLYLNSTSTVAIGGLAIRGGVTTAVNVLNTVALGYRAGYNIRSGADNNIFLGYQAGDAITTGDNNIIIGYDIDHISPALSNRLNIGNLIFGTGLDGTGTTLASGNVGIGTSTPLQKLQVRGDIRVGTTGSNGCLEDYGGGVIGGTCSSDERLKISIEPIAEEGRSYLEGIVALEPVHYKWNELASNLYNKDGDQSNLGLVAQNVEAVFPELVSRNSDNFRQVDFRALPFYLIEAIKELWMKVTGLEEKVKEIDELERRIERLEDAANITYTPPEPEPEQNPGTEQPENVPEESLTIDTPPPDEPIELEGPVQTDPVVESPVI